MVQTRGRDLRSAQINGLEFGKLGQVHQGVIDGLVGAEAGDQELVLRISRVDSLARSL